MNVGEVYLGLFGSDFDPSVARDAIPIDRAIAIPKGDPIPKYSSWRCSTGKIEHDFVDVYKMASTLVSELEPHTKDIVQIKERFGLEAVLQVVLAISTAEGHPTPAIGFNADVLDFVHAIGATIDIDTYLR